jgi:hypothetical protein
MDWLWAALGIVAMGLLAWLGFRIEPHWVSKDAHRFLCGGQLMSHLGQPVGRWRETRVIIDASGTAQVDQKRFLRHNSSVWSVSAESPQPPPRRVVFLLSGHTADGRPAMLALKLPTKSRAIEVLREAMRK